MSYQPPPEGSSNTPPEGEYTPPPASSGGGYSTPPPPSAGGGYSPPPAPTGGGYSTPPPPAEGGYSPPPPMTSMTPSGGGSSDMSHLPQSYMNAVTKPNVGTYEAEIPNASWIKILIGLGALAVVSFISTLIQGALGSAGASQFASQLGLDPQAVAAAAGPDIGAAFWVAIFTFVTFFLGAGVLFLMAKILGGQNGDFLVHSYLLSLSHVPIRIVAALVLIVPLIGFFIFVALFLYQIFCASLAIQVAHRMDANKARMAAFIPTAVGAVLACLGIIACGALIASMFAGIAGSR